MNHAMRARAQMVPATAILTTWVAQDWDRRDGVQVETLSSMDRVLVRTLNSVYEIIVEAGLRGHLLLRGGPLLQEVTRVSLAGSSLGGSFLKRLGIYVGFRLELLVNGETILTSPVRAISVCPVETPADHSGSH